MSDEITTRYGLAKSTHQVNHQNTFPWLPGPLLQSVWAPELLFIHFSFPTIPHTSESGHWRVCAKNLSRISPYPLIFFPPVTSGCFFKCSLFRNIWKQDTSILVQRLFLIGLCVIFLVVKNQLDLSGDDPVLSCYVDGVSRAGYWGSSLCNWWTDLCN